MQAHLRSDRKINRSRIDRTCPLAKIPTLIPTNRLYNNSSRSKSSSQIKTTSIRERHLQPKPRMINSSCPNRRRHHRFSRDSHLGERNQTTLMQRSRSQITILLSRIRKVLSKIAKTLDSQWRIAWVKVIKDLRMRL